MVMEATSKAGIYYEGYLKKDSGKGKWLKHWVRLKKMGLFFYDEQQTDAHIEVINITPHTRCVLAKRRTYSFRFLLFSENKTHVLKCDSPVERYRWMYMIDLATNGKPVESPPFCIPASYYCDQNSNQIHEGSRTIKSAWSAEEALRKDDKSLDGKALSRSSSRKSLAFFRKFSSRRKPSTKGSGHCESSLRQGGMSQDGGIDNNNEETRSGKRNEADLSFNFADNFAFSED